MSEKNMVSVDKFNELEQQLQGMKNELELSKQNELLALRIAVGYLLQEKQHSHQHSGHQE